ncbi:MAG: MFS transporter [Alphaproteobacteria bacterium]|nr:MFS transporter [Alphaproteobacteria bacterium]
MHKNAIFAVLVSALGYFVDVYDLILFSVVRVASLKDLGLTGDDLTSTGILLLNIQLAGMLIGGVLWGIYGDKKGRLAILFGSILMYSVANIANAFVTDVWQYGFCRLLAGLGLAGEIGAGITLVSEILPKDKRGIGTALVATMGVAGGLAAATIGDIFPWKTAYLVGGGMGLALFVMRLSVRESDLFNTMSDHKDVRRGDLRLLFKPMARFGRFITCVLVGMPIWFLAALIITLAPEIGKTLGLAGEVKASGAVLWFYGGLIGGDLSSGLLSQFLRSRKKALYTFIAAAGIFTLAILNLPAGAGADAYYHLCGVIGFFAGYWAIFLTTSAESFGTNLRATVTTSIPNLVRGGAILLSSAFGLLRDPLGVIPSLTVIGAITFGAALVSVWLLRETFAVDLDYVEA